MRGGTSGLRFSTAVARDSHAIHGEKTGLATGQMDAINRRDLFTTGLRWLLRLPSQLAEPDGEEQPAFLRPPGAVAEEDLVARCTTCGDCVVACEYEAIRLLDHTAGRLQGTPAVIPREQPCRYCAAFPCIDACTEGALTHENLKMGTAVVRHEHCLMQHGAWCDQCIQKCPLGDRAIRFAAGFRLVVNEEVCTGCGICEYVCPTTPPAIHVRALRPRTRNA